MATELEQKKWELYKKRHDVLFTYGIKNNLIKLYDDELITNLRHIYSGGLPASIYILHDKLSNGFCYDRASLITLGFGDDDFQVVSANIDNLRLNPKYIDTYRLQDVNYANHCFAERIKSDGTTWVYDTSVGLVFEKNLYYKLERPQITKLNDKASTLEFMKSTNQFSLDIGDDKYILPMVLPMLEKYLVPVQPFYLETLKEEIDVLKTAINYEKLVEEIDLALENDSDAEYIRKLF